MANFKIQKGEFCKWIWENTDRSKAHINIIMENIEKKYNFNDIQLNQIRRKVSSIFISQYHRYWKMPDEHNQNLKKRTDFL